MPEIKIKLIGREKGALEGVALGRRMVIDCLHDAYGGKREEFERMTVLELVDLHVDLRQNGHDCNAFNSKPDYAGALR